MIPNIGLFDIILTTLYILIISFIAYRFQQKKKEHNPEYHYFLFGLSIKVIGSIAFALISIYYYQGGDTFRFFKVSENIRTLFFTDFADGLNLLITPFSELSSLDYDVFGGGLNLYERPTTWFFARVLFFFNTICFGSYLCCSVIFSVLSFLGLWLGFSSFTKCFPQVKKLLFLSFFLIPTATIWSSGILRDTLLMAMFGLFLFSFVNMFYLKRSIRLSIGLVILSMAMILLLKPVVFFVLFSSWVIYVVLFFLKQQKSLLRKSLILVSSLVLVASLFMALNHFFLEENNKYQFDNLMTTLKGFHTIHPDYPVAESYYSLGEIQYNILGVLEKIPSAINVTFFRPYLWEVTSLSTFIAALESFLLVVLLAYLFIKLKSALFKIIYNQLELIFLLIFSISYAFVSGIGANNFGMLTRFKIPSVLFLCIAITIILSKSYTFKDYRRISVS